MIKYDTNVTINPPINKLIYDIIDFHYDPEKDKDGSSYSFIMDETPLAYMSHRVINHQFIGLIETIFKDACALSSEYIMPIVVNNSLERFHAITTCLKETPKYCRHTFYSALFESEDVQTHIKNMFMIFMLKSRKAIRNMFQNQQLNLLYMFNPNGLNSVAQSVLFYMYQHETVYHTAVKYSVTEHLMGDVYLRLDEDNTKLFTSYIPPFYELIGIKVSETDIENVAHSFDTVFEISKKMKT
jgi:hypothetical protein